jgi:hypothetical protein
MVVTEGVLILVCSTKSFRVAPSAAIAHTSDGAEAAARNAAVAGCEARVCVSEGKAALADLHGLEDPRVGQLLDAHARVEVIRHLGVVGLDAPGVRTKTSGSGRDTDITRLMWEGVITGSYRLGPARWSMEGLKSNPTAADDARAAPTLRTSGRRFESSQKHDGDDYDEDDDEDDDDSRILHQIWPTHLM